MTTDDRETCAFPSRNHDGIQTILHGRSSDFEKLDVQSDWLKVTLASIRDAVISTDGSSRVQHMNRAAEILTGWMEADAFGRPLTEVFQVREEEWRLPCESTTFYSLAIGQAQAGKRTTMLISRDGSEKMIEHSTSSIEPGGEKPTGSVLVFRDISSQHQLHEQIRTQNNSERFLASIIESSNDAIVSKSLDGIIQTWNGGAQRLFGYTSQQAIGSHISLIIPVDRMHDEDLILGRICAGERVEHYETIRRTIEGNLIHVSITVSPIRNEAGIVVGASKIARDISDRIRAEIELHQSEQRYRALAEASATVVWRTNPKGEVVFASDDWNKITGQTDDENKGWGWLQAVHADDHAKTLALWTESLKSKTLHENQFRVRLRDGSYRWFAVRGVPVFDVDGSVREWVGANTDFHDRKLAEDALRRLAADLSDMDRRKDEFLATLAHELRNPLAPIRSGLQVLQLSDISEDEANETRVMMERQLNQLVRLVDDLMDVSRIVTGKIELQWKTVSLSDVLDSAIETSRSLIDQMNHQLSVSLPGSPIRLDADFTRLSQVFLNLLNNAAKYSEPNGKINVDAKQEGDEVVVSIRDSGIGISSENLPLIFDMFTQADQSLEKSRGGLGIGLSLVRRLVEMHQGSVEAKSAGAGRGSEFVVRIPTQGLRPTKIVEQSTDVGTAMNGSLRILIVDDNRDSVMTLTMLLKRLGHQTRAAFDGEEAVAAAREFHPQVVLLDIGLPKLNGYEVCRWIRAQSQKEAVTIIAQTGWGQEETRQKTKDAGFDFHMVKPLDPNALRKILDKLTNE